MRKSLREKATPDNPKIWKLARTYKRKKITVVSEESVEGTGLKADSKEKGKISVDGTRDMPKSIKHDDNDVCKTKK